MQEQNMVFLALSATTIRTLFMEGCIIYYTYFKNTLTLKIHLL